MNWQGPHHVAKTSSADRARRAVRCAFELRRVQLPRESHPHRRGGASRARGAPAIATGRGARSAAPGRRRCRRREQRGAARGGGVHSNWEGDSTAAGGADSSDAEELVEVPLSEPTMIVASARTRARVFGETGQSARSAVGRTACILACHPRSAATSRHTDATVGASALRPRPCTHLIHARSRALGFVRSTRPPPLDALAFSLSRPAGDHHRVRQDRDDGVRRGQIAEQPRHPGELAARSRQRTRKKARRGRRGRTLR